MAVAGSRGRYQRRSAGAAGARRRSDEEPREPKSRTPEEWEAYARSVCLDRLGRMAQTRSQLAGALGKRGVPEEIAERVLDRFTEVSLIDDAAYAEQFVRSRHQERGLARRALGYELRGRGVAAETIGDALGGLGDDEERATARRLVDAKLRTIPPGRDPAVVIRRLSGMLARKGYPPGVALGVVREALDERGVELGTAMLDALDVASHGDPEE